MLYVNLRFTASDFPFWDLFLQYFCLSSIFECMYLSTSQSNQLLLISIFPFGNNDDSELTIHDKNAESWDISDLLKASLWKQ